MLDNQGVTPEHLRNLGNQVQGNDLAAPDSKPTQSELKSAQGTIEDKLDAFIKDYCFMLDRVYKIEAKQQLQAIITTETTKKEHEARIDEIKWMQKQIPKKVKGMNYGTPQTNPHGWAYETYIEAWKPVLKSRLAALQKEQNE